MSGAAPAAQPPGGPHGPQGQTGEVLVLTPYTGSAIDIPISQYSFDVAQTLNIGAQGSGAGAGKITFNPLTVTTEPDANSPALLQAAATGAAFKTAVLVVPAAAGGTETYAFSLVAVKTVAWAGGSGGPGASSSEQIGFEYGGLSLTSTSQAGTTQASFGWNGVTNQASN